MIKSSGRKENPANQRKPLTGMLAEFREALDDEIDKINSSGQSSTLLHSGRQIESPGTDSWYRFSVEYMPTLPADTPCKLFVGKDQFDVTVIGCEENQIIVSSHTPLPDAIGSARLENGATVLMELLIKCIEEKESGNREFASAEAAQREALEKMQLPEVADFCAQMLPCFSETLDRLTRGAF